VKTEAYFLRSHVDDKTDYISRHELCTCRSCETTMTFPSLLVFPIHAGHHRRAGGGGVGGGGGGGGSGDDSSPQALLMLKRDFVMQASSDLASTYQRFHAQPQKLPPPPNPPPRESKKPPKNLGLFSHGFGRQQRSKLQFWHRAFPMIGESLNQDQRERNGRCNCHGNLVSVILVANEFIYSLHRTL